MDRIDRQEEHNRLRRGEMTKLILLLLPLLLVVGCALQGRSSWPTFAENEGALYLYAAPLTAAQSIPPCVVTAVSALQQDGRRLPLTVQLSNITPQGLNRQRRFAAGALPAGDYLGLELQSQCPTTSLPLPQEIFIPAPFRIEAGMNQLLQLTLSKAPGGKGEEGGWRATAASILQHSTAFTGSVSSSPHFVTFFDRQSHEVTGVVTTGEEPAGMAVDLSRQRLYVALAGSDAVEIIDTTAGRVISRINLTGGDEPGDLALIDSGKTLLVVNRASSTLSFIDPLGEFEEERIRVAIGPHRIVVSPQEDRAWLFSADSGLLSLIDLPSRVQRQTVATAAGETTGVLDRRGESLYVAQQESSMLQIINPATLQPQQLFAVGMGLQTLVGDPLTGLLYGAHRNDPAIQVYEPQGMHQIASLNAAEESIDLTIDGAQHRLYAVQPESESVNIYNLSSRESIAAIDLVGKPKRILLFEAR
jgi:DNA-binding beta-propeller fold protein YncE